ncbi:MAG TPA: hypothetical protein VHW00_02560 [Thermoanaerobaculia bacterium]|nr:hypothetical protein [Thermoanaerobaculia bacterium]
MPIRWWLLFAALVVTRALQGAPLTITAPANDSLITTARITVQGTAEATSRNIAVLVNDVAANLDLEHAGTSADPFRWSVELQPASGRVKLTARIIDAKNSGGPTAIRHVEFAPDEHAVLMTPFPAAGVVPASTHVTIRPHLDDEITRVQVDYESDGIFDEDASGYADTFDHEFTTPGIRTISARITFADGTVRTSATTFTAASFATVNALLQSTWRGFGDALQKRDIDGALEFVAESKHEKYRSPLTLIRPALPQYAADTRRILPVEIRGDTAHYLLPRVQGVETHGYHVYFARGSNGLWKIVQF